MSNSKKKKDELRSSKQVTMPSPISEIPDYISDESEEETGGQQPVEVSAQPATPFKVTGPVGCEVTVAIHYLKDGIDPTNVSVLTKEFKGKTFADVVETIRSGVQRLNSQIKPKGGFLVKIHCRKLVVTGFSDASGTYMHERAMSAISALIYLLSTGPAYNAQTATVVA